MSYAVPVYGPVEASAGVGYRRHYGEEYRRSSGGGEYATSYYVPVEASVRVGGPVSVYGRADLNAALLYRGDPSSDRTQVGVRLRLTR